MPRESTVLQKSAAGDRELQCRIYAEYEEMPGLKLTLRQASRLFNVDVPTCERVLVELVAAGLLGIVDGLFVLREHVNYVVSGAEDDMDDERCRARSDLPHASL
jgi:hypothetical protein